MDDEDELPEDDVVEYEDVYDWDELFRFFNSSTKQLEIHALDFNKDTNVAGFFCKKLKDWFIWRTTIRNDIEVTEENYLIVMEQLEDKARAIIWNRRRTKNPLAYLKDIKLEY